VPRKSNQRYTITIKNWKIYQREMRGGEKRRRRRDWVAISVDLFSDPDFFSMDQVHRNAWVGLLCHAGKVGPVFDLCSSDARVMFQLRRSPDFEVFKNHGFIDLKTATDKTVQDNASLTDKTAKKSKKRTLRFEEWWGFYPKKVGKIPAEKKWASMNLDPIADKIISDTIFRLENDVKWKDGYIKDPLTYLNQRSFDDEHIQTRRPGDEGTSAERAAEAASNVEASGQEPNSGA